MGCLARRAQKPLRCFASFGCGGLWHWFLLHVAVGCVAEGWQSASPDTGQPPAFALSALVSPRSSFWLRRQSRLSSSRGGSAILVQVWRLRQPPPPRLAPIGSSLSPLSSLCQRHSHWANCLPPCFPPFSCLCPHASVPPPNRTSQLCCPSCLRQGGRHPWLGQSHSVHSLSWPQSCSCAGPVVFADSFWRTEYMGMTRADKSKSFQRAAFWRLFKGHMEIGK